jgi:hypothetical protein
VPSDFDLIDYDKAALQKQTEYEVMKIKIADMNCADSPNGIKREVIRYENVQAKFLRLQEELDSLAKQYSKDIDEIYSLFEEVGCSKEGLKKLLTG